MESLFSRGTQWDRRRVPSKPKKPGGKQKGKVKKTMEELKLFYNAMSLGSLHARSWFSEENWSHPTMPATPREGPSTVSEVLQAKNAAAAKGSDNLPELAMTEEEVEENLDHLALFVPMKQHHSRHSIPSTVKAGWLIDRFVVESEVLEFSGIVAVVKAVEGFERDLAKAKEVHDLELEFTAQCKLGMALARQNVEDAAKWFLQAGHTAELLDDDWRRWIVLHDYGTMYRMHNSVEKALAYDDKCLDLAQEMLSPALEAIAYFNLAAGYHLLNYLRKSEKFYKLSRRITAHVRCEEKYNAAEANINMVKVYVKRAQKKKEEEEALRQKEINKKKRLEGLGGKK